VPRHAYDDRGLIKAVKLPTVKSLDSFEFLALPSLNKMLVLELRAFGLIERRARTIVPVVTTTSRNHCLATAAPSHPTFNRAS
jgi:hypothetical protein